MIAHLRAWLRDEPVRRCAHCNRPVGNAEISQATTNPTPTGGTVTVTRTWHADKPACAAAAWAYEDDDTPGAGR